MTNFERVKAMSVEELAGFLESTSNDLAIKLFDLATKLFNSYVAMGKECIQDWLESEVTYDD